ncbi:hypothetical protein J8L70_12965 [Pseudoalteromonas sp. MMG010]|uniref:hypothetical protein n=1 Tax=Pseudoalteromonas sp. MMG010 TaxID=2822685 RepID=UPI001B3A0DA3|nr:hypothetical protein [Pseudoalteromonas sp. MMG010]MBQ4834158.1 hypothetical protein [Pseudoalteromonas sp. MMG010]
MDFSAINKQASNSFHRQRNILKKLAQGQEIQCDSCNKPLSLNLNNNDDNKGLISCQAGCTHILLELGG